VQPAVLVGLAWVVVVAGLQDEQLPGTGNGIALRTGRGIHGARPTRNPLEDRREHGRDARQNPATLAQMVPVDRTNYTDQLASS